MKKNHKIKIRLALILTCLLAGFACFAQVSSYSFTSSAGAYIPITGGTVYGTATSDDQRFVDPATPAGGTITTGVGIPIGFNFTYNGIVFDRMAINNNGWISLGQSSLNPSVNNASSSGYTAISATSTATPTLLRNRIAALSRDIQAQTGAELRVETIGTSPNMICVIQWSNYRKFGATGDNFNFQIRLYETTNVVEVVYGTMVNNATAATPQVGLSGTINTDFNNRTTTTDWSATTAGVANNATCNLSATVVPLSGQTFTWTPPAPCAGAPSVGTTTSTTNPVCSGVNFTLGMSAPPFGVSGITYQWQSSTDGITYANITGATSATLTTSQTVSTYYQVIVNCTSSGMADTTSVLNVTMSTPTNCYCTSNATSTADEDIFNVTLGTLNNSSTCLTTGGAGSIINQYSNYTATVAAPTLTQGATYPFSVEIGTCGGSFTNSTRIFIDYNQNGLFTDAGETVYTSAAGTAGAHTESANITIPITATVGNTRMRVVTVETGTPTGITPCGTYTWGETEDYLIDIAAAVPCAGTPSPGVTQSNAASVCAGTTFTLSMSTPPTGIAGIIFQWQSSPDGITYSDITGATNQTYATTQTDTTYYQVIVTCTNSSLSDTATAVLVTMNPFSSCYCTSSATNTADEDIFNVSLGTLSNSSACATTGGPGSVMNQYSDYTTVATAPNLAQSAVYSLSVQIGTCGGNFTNSTRVFIDYNQNGLFTDAGETVYTSATGTAGPHTETGNITIPVTALTGNTRMRVVTVETGTPTSITPCGTYTWGETEDYLINVVPLPPNPPTPVQDPATPACATGTDLTVPGTPVAGDAWYWQTTALGTSTANIVSGAYTVFLNGTYYVRTYNAANNVWSIGSDSVVVSNIPYAPTPPAPTAAASPACLTTTISMSAPASGTAYFWQGTNSMGASNAENAIIPDTINVSGTYYVAAYDSLTSCWSLTNSVSVIIENYVPAEPTTTSDSVVICQGTSSVVINASGGGSGSVTSSFGLNLISTGTGASTYSVTVPAIPAGATITSTQLEIISATAIGGSYRSEIRVALSGATTLAPTQISTLTSAGLITPDPSITVPALPLAGGNVTLSLTETFDDAGTDATFGEIRLVISYTLPPSTINWWDSPTAGTMQGTGSPFETIGTLLLPYSDTSGTFTFYATATSGACSSTRLPIDVTINPLPLMVLNDTAICSGTNVVLDAQNAGYTYLWNTSDTTQTISVSSGGLYFVDIITPQGCSARDSINLIINSLPIVNLGADVSFCAGDSILIDAGNTGFNFLWNDSTTNQSINASVGGNYFVTVTNPATTCASTDTILVTVNALPVINLGIDSSLCIGDSLILDAGNAGANYLWNNSSTNQTLTVNTAGIYSVVVTNPITTCVNADTISLTLNALPVVNIGADTAICFGDTLTLDAGYPGSTYTWSNSSVNQTLNVSSAGSYFVFLVDPDGCKGNDSINVSINTLPVVNLGADVTQCAGTVMLDAANPGSVFMWNDFTNAQTLTASTTGTYYVAVTDNNNCTSIDSVDITINPLPVISLGNDTIQCGGSLTLDAGNPGFNHLWYDSSTGQTLTVYSTNTISVTVTNPVTGCLSMDTIMVTFNQYPLVNLGSDTAQCAGSVLLNAGNPGASFIWSTTATSQTVNVSSSGIYYVSVTANGCTTNDSVMVTINSLPVIGFPAIAPLCLQDIPIALVATPAGGVFSGSTALSSGMFDPALAGVGSHPVLYTYTDANSCTNSITQTINVEDCTGIEEYESFGVVNVYPNPTSGMFVISFENANFSELNISIVDIQGKDVYNYTDKNIPADYNKVIDLEGIAKGIYYIKLNTGDDMKIQKLIIN